MVLVQNSIRFSKLIPVYLKLFHRTESKGTMPNSFCEATVTLIPKQHKDSAKKENFRSISLMNTDENILLKIQTKCRNISETSAIMKKPVSSQECRDHSI